jgi:hypothetical protein
VFSVGTLKSIPDSLVTFPTLSYEVGYLMKFNPASFNADTCLTMLADNTNTVVTPTPVTITPVTGVKPYDDRTETRDDLSSLTSVDLLSTGAIENTWCSTSPITLIASSLDD